MHLPIFIHSYADGDSERESFPVLTNFMVEVDRDTLTVSSAWSGSLDIDPRLLERLVGGRDAMRRALEAALERAA